MTVPFDLAATQRDSDWRKHLVWPQSYDELRHSVAQTAELVSQDILRIKPGPLANAAIVAAPALLQSVMVFSSAATLVKGARKKGVSLDGGPPELVKLMGGVEGKADYTQGSFSPPPVKSRLDVFRRIARTASWTAPARMLGTFIQPEALALTHNPLLRSYARHSSAAAYFFPVEQMAEGSPAPPQNSDLDLYGEYSDQIIESVGNLCGLDGDLKKVHGSLLKRDFSIAFHNAHMELSRVQSLHPLPKQIWSGSFSTPRRRAMAVSVRAQGGEVSLFDHGGAATTAAASYSKAAYELSLADRLIVPTSKTAKILAEEWSIGWRESGPDGTFVGAQGDPSMLLASHADKASPGAGRKRVMYLPKPMLGFRELLPPVLPDPVTLDWQLRLAEMLEAMPVNVSVRPHPEGLLPSGAHPVCRKLPMSVGPIEKAFTCVDRLVFEYAHSTAFWEALCTDRPVVLIDLGDSALGEEVSDIVARRCRVVRAKFDKHNRPQIDRDELGEAVRGGADTVDPSEIRSLFIA